MYVCQHVITHLNTRGHSSAASTRKSDLFITIALKSNIHAMENYQKVLRIFYHKQCYHINVTPRAGSFARNLGKIGGKRAAETSNSLICPTARNEQKTRNRHGETPQRHRRAVSATRADGGEYEVQTAECARRDARRNRCSEKIEIQVRFVVLD